MARTEARTQTAIWDNTEFLELPPVQKAVYWVLYSQADMNHCGVIALRVGRWAKKFGVTAGQFRAALDGLESARFIVIDDEFGELAIRTFIRNDGVYKQPNILRSAHRSLAQVFSSKIRHALAVEVKRLVTEFSESVPDSSKPILEAMLADLDQASSKPSRSDAGTPSEGFPEGFGEGHASHLGEGGKGKGEEVEVRTTKASDSSRPDTSEKPKRKIPKADQQPRPDVDEICQSLVEHRVRLKCKRPKISQEWRTEARRMFDIDKRPLQEALELLDWCQNDRFWKTNIESIPTFRDQYDKLRLRSEEQQAPSNVVALRGNQPEDKQGMFERAMERAAERDREAGRA